MLLAGLSFPPAPAQSTFPGGNGMIAFQTYRDGNPEVYTMNADGTGQTRRTSTGVFDGSPAWSPDGTKIAFVSYRDGNYEIYTMNADGTGQTRRTSNSAIDGSPAWSPDGTKIAFASNRDGNFEIYTMNADGTGQTNRTNNASADSEPSWSPDGSKIAFQTNRDSGDLEIYTMNADGTGQTNRTNHAGWDVDPDWQPLSNQHLSVSVTGSGSGTVTATGINCPGTCSHSYTTGAMVTLTATPASGSAFSDWSGGGCSGTGSCTVTMSSDQSVIATFTVTAGGGSSGGPTGGGGGTTGVSSAQIAVLLAGQLTPSGKAAKIAALLKSGGFTVVFKALEAGTAVINWYQVPPGAKLAKKAKPKPVLVAAGKRTFSAAGTATIKIKLTAAGKRLLKHAKKLKLTAKGTFTPTGKAPITATRTFVLKR
jgi:hypothetical protein